jgi:hypothetical protein
MFIKNPLYETMEFIEFFLDEMKNPNQKKINNNNKTFLKKSCDFMNEFLEGYCGNPNLSSEFFEGVFKGYTKYKHDTYLFFDISSIDISNLFIRSEEMIWFGLGDEILNHKKICGFDIHHSITTFFKNQPHFLQLIQNKTICDSPIVCYSGEKTMEKTKFVNLFGVSSSDTQYGEFYVLTDFSNAIKHGNKGIVRIAFFTKKMVNVSSQTNHHKKNTIPEEFDTYYQMDDETMCQEWLFKNFTQEVPLTFHENFHNNSSGFNLSHLSRNYHHYNRNYC